jgi:hypothetical protein
MSSQHRLLYGKNCIENIMPHNDIIMLRYLDIN